MIEDLRIARFPYVSVGSPQGVESPSGRLCLVCGGHIFPTYACGIDPIAHAEAPASPGSAAIPTHLPPSLTTPFVAPPVHRHHLLLTTAASHHPTGVLPERRRSQATTGAPSVVCRKLPPELPLPLVAGHRRDPLCHGYMAPLRRGRRLTPGEASPHKRRLKCDTNISPRRLMIHLLHQMVHHRTTLCGNGQRSATIARITTHTHTTILIIKKGH